MFLGGVDVDDIQLVNDIKECYLKYRISPDEYFLFDFEHRTEEERDSYLSDKCIYITMAAIEGRRIHDKELEDKINFHRITKDFFLRDACGISKKSDYEIFASIARKHEKLIIKRNDSSCGYGIKIVTLKTEKEIKDLFAEMIKSGHRWIAEELIKQVPEMSVWNESSVNTIRLSTFLNKSGFHILCPFMRMGRKGSIVDNGGQGGTYCCIDSQTGIVITDGMDERNNRYVFHPDSGITYKGWQVPKWNELITLAEKLHKTMPKHKYVAWDFALSDKGWALIEGNWGQFVCQQSCMNRGYKKEFMDLVNG